MYQISSPYANDCFTISYLSSYCCVPGYERNAYRNSTPYRNTVRSAMPFSYYFNL